MGLPRWFYRWKWRLRDNRRTYVVTLRLTSSQAEAFKDMMAQWNTLGSWGASRWTSFYADGDGDFKPYVRVNGQKPRFTRYVPDRSQLWENGKEYGNEYRIDYDLIAWRMLDR